jgi:hypothetical protein
MQSQCDFLEKVALPMFEVWAAVFPNAEPILTNTEANLKLWKVYKPPRAAGGQAARVDTRGGYGGEKFGSAKGL